jgi:hypothetical protein
MNDGYVVRKSPAKGEAVFATRTFAAGETVMVGIIKEVLGKNDSHASQVSKDKYIRHAGAVPKVNHSCNPNCGIRVNETGAHNFIAIRKISPDEEITFDYAMRNYEIDHFPKQCACGSRNCRGLIKGWKHLPVELKKKYKDIAAPYLLELDDISVSA